VPRFLRRRRSPLGFAAGAFASDSLSPLARQFVSAQSPGLATFEHSIRRYATDPSWTLRANTDDDYAALTEWARDDDDVTLVREYQHTKGDGGTVTIGAPVATVAGGYLNDGVADEPWVTAADLNVVTSLVAPKNIPVDAREFEQLAGIESFVLSTLQGQESFDATEFQASDDSSKSTLAFDAETTTLEQGRTITNDTSADGAGAPRGRRYRPHVRFGYLRAHGHRRRLGDDRITRPRGVDELRRCWRSDGRCGGRRYPRRCIRSRVVGDSSRRIERTQAVSRRRAGRRPLHRARTRPRRRLRRRRGYRDRRSGRDGRWRGRNVHESRVTALHRGTGGRDRVRDRTRQHDRRRFRK